MKRNFKNILVIRTDRIGDVVLTVPALRALKKAFPQARLSVWVSPATRELIEGLPFIDEVISHNTSRLVLWKLIFLRFDLAVNFHTKQKTNLACFLAGIPHRLGFHAPSKYSFLLNHTIQDDRQLGLRHEAENCLHLLTALGIHDNDLTLELARSPEADQWADRFLQEHQLQGQQIVILHPDASDPAKCWPVESFAELGRRLISKNVRLIVIGTAKTAAKAKVISDSLAGQCLDLTGAITLSQMVSLLRRAQLLVSNDSGPVHVAAAVGTPVISLFLRTQPGINPERWRPLGPKSIVLVNQSGEEVRIGAKSQVIGGRFDSISVEAVFSQCLKSMNL